MPVYDLRCPECLIIQKDVYQPSECEQPLCDCGERVERVWLKGVSVEIFPAGFFEHAADEDGKSPYFESRQKYKSYLRDHGMYAELVEGR